MSRRWTQEDLQRVNANLAAQIASPLECKTPKYRNRRVSWQGQKFDSQHELDVFRAFELERIAGKYRAVVRQVSFPMSGTTRRIRVDFMLVLDNGSIRWVDAKGYETDVWRLKRDQIWHAFGIKIETV